MSQHPGFATAPSEIRPVDEEINPLMTAHGESFQGNQHDSPLHQMGIYQKHRSIKIVDSIEAEIVMKSNTISESCNAREWLAERKVLLADEKELTKHRDRVNAKRRRMPMVRIDKEYVFEGADGKTSLLDLFEGRRQLIVYHFMFDPAWAKAVQAVQVL